MCALVVGRVRSPASGFEGSRVYEAIVHVKKAFSDAVCDFVKIACAKLVRDESKDNISLPARYLVCDQDVLFKLNDRHDGGFDVVSTTARWVE